MKLWYPLVWDWIVLDNFCHFLLWKGFLLISGMPSTFYSECSRTVRIWILQVILSTIIQYSSIVLETYGVNLVIKVNIILGGYSIWHNLCHHYIIIAWGKLLWMNINFATYTLIEILRVGCCSDDCISYLLILNISSSNRYINDANEKANNSQNLSNVLF